MSTFVLMLVNAAVLTGLHFCYPRDVRQVIIELDRCRAGALADS